MEVTVNIPVFGKKYIGNPVGLGDIVRRLTDAAGIRLDTCGCEQRQQLLNRIQFTKIGQPAQQQAYQVPVE